MSSRAHDTSYKQLFNSPLMVQDLLQGYVTEAGLGPLAPDGIEPLPPSFVTPGLRAKHSDQIWRVRLADGGEVYAIIEFQSRPDPAMALRTCLYSALLYEALMQNHIISPDRLPWPAVLCVVIYNGRRRWRGSPHLHDCIWQSKTGLLRRGLLRHSHVLVDMHAQDEQNMQANNLVSLLMRFERTRNQQEFVELLSELNDLLPHTGELRGQFARWIFEKVGPDSTWAEMTQDVLFNEGEVMYLAKRFAAWDRKMERKGERKGELKGKLAMQNTLSKLLEKRFGPIDAQTGQRIQKASLAQLDEWVLRSVDARTVSEVFEQAL